MEQHAERLEIGQTIGFAFQTVGAKAAPFALLVLAIGGVNGLLDLSGSSAATRLSSFTSLILDVLATYFALKVRCGDDLVIKMAFGRALGVNILSGLGILLGLILLIVPGLYLWAIWALAVPALMAEDLSVSQALSRSKSLSQGQWVRLLALGLLTWVPITLFAVGSYTLADSFFGKDVQTSLPFNLLVDIVIACGSAVSSVLMAEAYITLSGQRSRLTALQDIFA